MTVVKGLFAESAAYVGGRCVAMMWMVEVQRETDLVVDLCLVMFVGVVLGKVC